MNVIRDLSTDFFLISIEMKKYYLGMGNVPPKNIFNVLELNNVLDKR